MTIANLPADEAQELSNHRYDFIDFGCSDGNSIELAKFLYKGGRGLGIDMDEKKVASARKAGHEAMCADITKLESFEGAVRFVFAHHFLEHLNDTRQAEICIRSACRLARDFVFIKQPYFDADPYLLGKRLQFYWSHWTCHSNHMTALDFVQILLPMQASGTISRFVIYAVSPVESSNDPVIHSIYSPRNQQQWVKGKHPEKCIIPLEGVFREIAVLIKVGSEEGFDYIEKRTPKSITLYDSIEFAR